MTFKDDMKAFQAHWIEVDAFIDEERRTASIELRWQQLNAAYAIAKGLGMLHSDPDELDVFKRWATLKEKVTSQLPKD